MTVLINLFKESIKKLDDISVILLFLIILLMVFLWYFYTFYLKISVVSDCYKRTDNIQKQYLDCKNEKECEKYKIVFQQYQCEKLAETLKKIIKNTSIKKYYS